MNDISNKQRKKVRNKIMKAVNENHIEIKNKDIKAIIFRNFAGQPDSFHPKGGMGVFTAILEDEKAKELESKGLSVAYKENRDGDLEARLKIFVRFDKRPPKICQITNKNRVELNAETVGCLDNAEIEEVNLVIDPSHWEMNGRSGIKAYLKYGKFKIAEDQFYNKYFGSDDSDDIPWMP